MFEESMEPPDGDPPTPGETDRCDEPGPSQALGPAQPALAEPARRGPWHKPEPLAEQPETEFDPFARLSGSQQRWQRAGAERVADLLDAYEEAMAELVAVFGPDADDRGGPFARSFLLEAAQVLHV